MIDRKGRADLAAALERLASGQITNDQFEDALGPEVTASRDAEVRAVFDDLPAHALLARGRDARRIPPPHG